MAYLNVDLNKLNSTSRTVDSYILSMKNQMNAANSEVALLSNEWRGRDAMQFKAMWDSASGDDSTYTRMLRALESYSNYLKTAEKEYKNAQARAINRANALPRY